MVREIKITVRPVKADRVYHISEEDVRIVLSRLPANTIQRVKAIYFNYESWGVRKLGYTNRGRREIALCALPPRVSLTRFLVKGQTPEQFGAKQGAQWPLLAIRRFMLYDVLLHEIGHLQIIDDTAKGEMRKFAREPKSQEFAMYWCKKLWSQHYGHPNPVHNKPTREELKQLKL
ncbi:hypothetical protein ACFLSX_02030 [Calditrichota bacterium]